jgi:hypothetical protein
MAFILTRPAVTLTGIPGTILTDINLPVSTPVVADSVQHAYNTSVKWLVTLLDPAGHTLISSYEILAMHKNGTNPKFTKYAIIGDRIIHNVDVTITGGDLQLKITNNETIGLQANIVRIQTIT